MPKTTAEKISLIKSHEAELSPYGVSDSMSVQELYGLSPARIDIIYQLLKIIKAMSRVLGKLDALDALEGPHPTFKIGPA